MIAVSSPMRDLSGLTVDQGRLSLITNIGSGSYGYVYRAYDAMLSKHVAVKVMAKSKPNSHQWGYQQRELQLHSIGSRHSNVVQLHRFFEEGGYVFVVLELCEGGDLFKAITETNIFDRNAKAIKDVFVQLLDAIEYCHSQSIAHRDIKPENILIGELDPKTRLQVYLADFGLSTTERVSKQFGVGSSFYISPECLGEMLPFKVYSTKESDIWSLGIVLVNLLTGRCPWRWARCSDSCFASYLHDPAGFLLRVLPISIQCNDLLRRIFTLNPLSRISIPDLRRAVLAMDEFWMAEDEVAPTVAKQAPPQRPRILDTDEMSSASGSSFESTIIPVFASAATTAVAPSSSSSSTSSSSDDSEGPITPETAAVNDADVDVVEALDINDEVVVEDVSVEIPRTGKRQDVDGKKRRSSFLRTALNRFTGKAVVV